MENSSTQTQCYINIKLIFRDIQGILYSSRRHKLMELTTHLSHSHREQMKTNTANQMQPVQSFVIIKSKQKHICWSTCYLLIYYNCRQRAQIATSAVQGADSGAVQAIICIGKLESCWRGRIGFEDWRQNWYTVVCFQHQGPIQQHYRHHCLLKYLNSRQRLMVCSVSIK